MPMPKPRGGETEERFMERCMASGAMNEEYPDADQRAAVCHRQWDKPKGDADMETKQLTRRLEVKAVNLGERTFEGLAATYDRDLGGDIIEAGAFKKTLREWKKSGRVLPLLDSHNWFSVRDTVGKLIAAEERDEGLWTKWLIVPGNDGDEILARLKGDAEHGAFIDSMSIGYRPVKVRYEDPEDPSDMEEQRTRYLEEIELHEVSLVLFPMNPAARIDSSSVKDAIRLMFARVPAEAKDRFRQEVQEVLEVQPTSPPAPEPPAEPEPKPRAVKRMPADYGLNQPDPNEPNTQLFDQIRLRRLGNS